jgi:RHS repeat-associated protein
LSCNFQEDLTWNTALGTPTLAVDHEYATGVDEGWTDYIMGPEGLPIEQLSDGNSSPEWYYADIQGNTRALADSTGAVLGTENYPPYGVATDSFGGTGLGTPLQYNGTYSDSFTGYVFDQARWYDPSTGQFLSQDPLVGGTLQGYAYAGDSPQNSNDPTGLGPNPCKVHSRCNWVDHHEWTNPNTGGGWLGTRLKNGSNVYGGVWARYGIWQDAWWDGAHWYLTLTGHIKVRYAVHYQHGKPKQGNLSKKEPVSMSLVIWFTVETRVLNCSESEGGTLAIGPSLTLSVTCSQVENKSTAKLDESCACAQNISNFSGVDLVYTTGVPSVTESYDLIDRRPPDAGAA